MPVAIDFRPRGGILAGSVTVLDGRQIGLVPIARLHRVPSCPALSFKRPRHWSGWGTAGSGPSPHGSSAAPTPLR